MCGICGVYDYNQTGERVGTALGPMLTAIAHRGPDDEGRMVDGSFAMGMRRLSIVDLAGGKQPIQSEDGRYTVVCNGEIYNHMQLRRELEARGHRFRSHVDVEVIVHLFEELGKACVHRLHGMFAFAVWDHRERKLVVARDRLGVKPLYYAHRGSRFVFGSEIKAVLAHPAIEPTLDLLALSDFLTLRYVPAPRTMFTGIEVLLPGHLLTASPGGVHVEEYWDVSFDAAGDENPISEEEAGEHLGALLDQAVERRLMSDVPFGAFLSGGLDSSGVVALMARHMSEPVRTFSVGFTGAGESHSELPFARQVAQRFATDHHEVLVGPEDFINNIERIVWHLDQPIGDYAEFAYDAVARLASRNVKMVLTGEGGDELFAGYGRHIGESLSKYFRVLPAPVKALILRSSERLKGARRGRTALVALAQATEAQRLANWIPLANPLQKVALLTADIQQAVGDHATEDVVAKQLERTSSTNQTQRLLYLDTKLWLPDYLLSRGDKLTMASSLEARVPLLDHELVDFAASLPARLKLHGSTRKYLLRKVTSPWLPDTVVNRPKQGFPNPFPQWLRAELRPFTRDLLSVEALKRRGLFSPNYVAKLLDEHESGAADHSTVIYGLLNVELWHRAFIDQRSAPAKGSVAETQAAPSQP